MAEKTDKYIIKLLDISHTAREPLEMGEVEGTFSEIEKIARHWCDKHNYDTWTFVRPKKTKVRRKSSKKT